MDEIYKEEKKKNRLSVFDKYEFEGKIGSGSYGIVYKAVSTNKDLCKAYAIKKLKVSTSSEEGLNMSACREITVSVFRSFYTFHD
jgi:serine/threonine protein kinase